MKRQSFFVLTMVVLTANIAFAAPTILIDEDFESGVAGSPYPGWQAGLIVDDGIDGKSWQTNSNHNDNPPFAGMYGHIDFDMRIDGGDWALKVMAMDYNGFVSFIGFRADGIISVTYGSPGMMMGTYTIGENFRFGIDVFEDHVAFRKNDIEFFNYNTTAGNWMWGGAPAIRFEFENHIPLGLGTGAAYQGILTLDNILVVADEIVGPDPSVIPAPSAILLGSFGVGFVTWLRRRRTI